MTELFWLGVYGTVDLQLFAGEGAGGGGGIGDGGAATGEGSSAAGGEAGNAAGADTEDAARQRLRELGVPEDKIRRRAKKSAVSLPAGAVTTAPAQKVQQTEGQDAAAADPTEDGKTDGEPVAQAPARRMTWDEIKADPEYNREMQAMMQARVRSARSAEDAMSKLAPALEVLARRHGMDVSAIDYEALGQAISDDNAYYEEKAMEMGVPVETAKHIDQNERNTAREKRERERTLEEQKIRRHFDGLRQQGEELKKTFPSFDLQTEMKNPVFVRLTSPGVGLSVEDAYHAIHRREIQSAAMQMTAQNTAEKIANDIRAGNRRPDEAGTSGQSPSVTRFDYSKASRAEREALKQRIRDAAARGEKVYPGQ